MNPLSHVIAGAVEILDGKFHQAIVLLRKAYALESITFTGFWLAKALAYNGEYDEACQIYKKISKDSEGTHWAKMSLFSMYAIQGKQSESMSIITEEFVDMMKKDEYYSIWMAESYALLGQKEESIDWVESGVNNFFINYPFLSGNDRFLTNIRGEERFKKLMEKVKHELYGI